MPPFRFIHSADLHLGRRFGGYPDDLRGRLVEARHNAINHLITAAKFHDAEHILIAGDLFDSETPTDPVWRQALAAMGANPALHWWIIPGNHDSLAAESLWSRFREQAPANVHLLDDVEPVEIAPNVFLLPAPLPRRYPGRDLTSHMPGCETDPRAFRIGLAHGSIQNFSEEGVRAEDTIPPDRAATARLDYLALGDWHGHVRVGDRTWYPGTPERDAFTHDGRGTCICVTLNAPGSPPQVETFPTGRFAWHDEVLPLLPGQNATDALAALLPPDRADRRDHLMRIRATGRATLAEHAALTEAAAAVAPDFAWFTLDTTALETEVEATDLDQIDRAGALRLAADRLKDRADDAALDGETRRTAAAALNRLYGYLREDRA
ncbi:DNA repair exonuclease [Rhodobacteraceae bacterium HSP-20]|uniref:DNA repair exonuclease n=1 Tax=Paragemmobacter amnigenus TaxID=2852097 RepID=A0ABS6J106_9RHOB|nr:DNA repair exonuclease [Rhodobacter amnigenus]MBU9697255.1 DNA repair exonuclease [Rhodobacter amnigenus]MBV4388482.1 DNA repair exonuclease [Rhodobacter amnigenus]